MGAEHRDDYPATYSDSVGSEETIISNDGKTLEMVVRGTRFTGQDFDLLEPVEPNLDLEQHPFSLSMGSLCDFRLNLKIPMLVMIEGREVLASLLVRLDLGKPAESGGVDREDLWLTLEVADHRIPSSPNGYFEIALDQIKRALPAGWRLKCCYGCQFSDYHPAGQPLFGGMACFRDNRAQYLAVKSKQDIFAVWNKRTEYVQETYLCDQFQPRGQRIGYRG